MKSTGGSDTFRVLIPDQVDTEASAPPQRAYP